MAKNPKRVWTVDAGWVDAKPKVRCIHCRKEKGLHHGTTLACPEGEKTRIGYIRYHQTNVFTPKEKNS